MASEELAMEICEFCGRTSDPTLIRLILDSSDRLIKEISCEKCYINVRGYKRGKRPKWMVWDQ